jgi:subtilase family serine protease
MTVRVHRKGQRLAVLAATSGLAIGAAVAISAPASAAPSSRALPGTHPSWARPSADRGAVPAASTVALRVYLAGRDPAGLAAYARAVSDPANASYGDLLSATAVQQRYGASAAQLSALRSWLSSHGLAVTATTAEYLQVKGSAAAVGSAFGTSLHQYATAHGVRRAPTTNASVPAAVSSAIVSVTGLSQSTLANQPAHVVKTGGSGAAPSAQADTKIPIGPNATCSSYYGQNTATGIPPGYTRVEPYSQCDLTPPQLRKAYGVSASGLTGKGATVAIVDAYGSSTMLADANQYSTNHGDRPFRPGQYRELVTPAEWNNQDLCGGPEGWAPEEALDVEMAHGLAPDAKVVYVGSNSCFDDDFLDAFNTIIDQHLADVVSNSWGEIMHSSAGDVPADLIATYEQTFERAAIEGIGFQFSSGDCGDDDPVAAANGANCDPTTTRAQTEFPTSDPWVTSVGGTALGLASRAGSYGFETSMGDRRSVLSADGQSWQPFPGFFYFGAGGGTSEDFAQPFYQRGVVPSRLAHTLLSGQFSSTAKRTVPDVAMSGDLVLATSVGISDGAPYSEAGFGGTSVSTPEFAGIQADAIQARGGRPIGFANPEIYGRANRFRDLTAPHKVLSDVVDLPANPDGSLRIRLYQIGADYGLTPARGYDTATGLGSPTAQYLLSFSRFR